MKQIYLRRGLPFFLVLALALVLLAGVSFPVHAAGGIEVSTSYPGMTVNAGDNLVFPLEFSAEGPGQSVTLSISSIPEGWEGHFTGNSSEISQVYVKGSDSAHADLNLSVPDTAESGSYAVVLDAEGESGSSGRLTLNLTVAAEEIGTSSFTAQYPEQEGSGSASFSFDTTLINNSATEQDYAFSSSAPTGWTVTFQPAGESTQVTSLRVEPRQSQGVTVTVTPSSNVSAGEYAVSCSAVSASDTLTTDLSVTVNGSYDLELSTPSGRLSTDVHAGKESSITLTLTNHGNTPLQNINMTSSVPAGWNIAFSEESVEVLEPEVTREITATITPGKDAIAGDYAVSVTASNSEVTDSAEFRISVKTQTLWGMVGILLILGVVAVLAYVIHKFGRR